MIITLAAARCSNSSWPLVILSASIVVALTIVIVCGMWVITTATTSTYSWRVPADDPDETELDEQDQSDPEEETDRTEERP